jgi:hypothetical protein
VIRRNEKFSMRIVLRLGFSFVVQLNGQGLGESR